MIWIGMGSLLHQTIVFLPGFEKRKDGGYPHDKKAGLWALQ